VWFYIRTFTATRTRSRGRANEDLIAGGNRCATSFSVVSLRFKSRGARVYGGSQSVEVAVNAIKAVLIALFFLCSGNALARSADSEKEVAITELGPAVGRSLTGGGSSRAIGWHQRRPADHDSMKALLGDVI